MSRLTLAVLVFLAGYTMFAPPGLCACWLLADVRDIHPHLLGQDPAQPHPHDYLLEMFHAQVLVVPQAQVMPVALWLQWLGRKALWHPGLAQALATPHWAATPPTPPPRLGW